MKTNVVYMLEKTVPESMVLIDFSRPMRMWHHGLARPEIPELFRQWWFTHGELEFERWLEKHRSLDG